MVTAFPFGLEFVGIDAVVPASVATFVVLVVVLPPAIFVVGSDDCSCSCSCCCCAAVAVSGGGDELIVEEPPRLLADIGDNGDFAFTMIDKIQSVGYLPARMFRRFMLSFFYVFRYLVTSKFVSLF